MKQGNTNLEVSEISMEYCYELNILYKTFDKILAIIKYANIQFFSGNDIEATIHYACAIKLFRELGINKFLIYLKEMSEEWGFVQTTLRIFI